MPDWTRLFADAPRPEIVTAETFVEAYGTASRPVRLICADGAEYVVKGSQAGRMIVTDQIVGRIGSRLGMPVGAPSLVDVPAELIAAEPAMGHFVPGVAHGSAWIPDCEQGGVQHCADNRERFSDLALLFGWALASDHQFIYSTASPRIVYSVDHGHFFAGSTAWSTQTLGGAPPTEPDQTICGQCGLTDDELNASRTRIGPISDELISSAVVAPPDEWGMTPEERVAVADYLALRRDALFGSAGA
jgi:hypothetical protein